ncbi:MAG: response regulator receiver protein [Novosphingobium sp.]|nr:response regulator receiver protein [Novosphingobium sp.]
MIGAGDYGPRLAAFRAALGDLAPAAEWRAEFLFESATDHCRFGSTADTLAWYEGCAAANSMTTARIPLSECRDWAFDPDSGSLVHASGEFFRVDGVRTFASPTREVEGGWDQPFLTQVGFDGGILGLLRQRFDGVPHYLVEAKAEPGNYRTVQITTTIQATFSNLKRAHGGKGTPYAELFTDPGTHGATVLADQWMSEDGGRLFNKRNRTMLVELPEDCDVPLIAARYRWVSLFQLKQLLAEQDAIVSPHIRGVLALV